MSLDAKAMEARELEPWEIVARKNKIEGNIAFLLLQVQLLTEKRCGNKIFSSIKYNLESIKAYFDGYDERVDWRIDKEIPKELK